MSAEVIDPIGRKANCSKMAFEKVGSDKAGYRKFWTMDFSITLDKTGVIEIGR